MAAQQTDFESGTSSLMARSPGETLLEIKGVSKSFGATPILKSLDLSVGKGEFLTLLGPSGCGKTTTLRLIAGFERPDSGRIILGGRDVTDEPAYVRDVHTVFQQYALFPHYNVFDNVAFSLRLEKLPPQEIARRVQEGLALVKLSGYEDRKVHQLSGGQMQRVALARALVGQPSLLLLDEPLGALDLKLRRAMQLELKSIQRKLGLTFVYVTHDQEEAMTMSDRIAVFSQGEIVQLGSPQEIYERPRTSFVADFIGSANILEARLIKNGGATMRLRLEGEVDIEISSASCGLKEGQDLRVAIRPERVSVLYEENGGAPAGTIRLKARVRDNVYLGNANQIFLTPFKSGKDLLSISMDTLHQGRRADGAEAWAEIRERDILVLEP